ncbi:hypothetical protein [Oceanobacillus sp. CAU 1775]
MNLIWISFITVFLLILCFACTLNFIESLQDGDKRVIRQSRLAAITCLSLALVIPLVYTLIAYDI